MPTYTAKNSDFTFWNVTLSRLHSLKKYDVYTMYPHTYLGNSVGKYPPKNVASTLGMYILYVQIIKY